MAKKKAGSEQVSAVAELTTYQRVRDAAVRRKGIRLSDDDVAELWSNPEIRAAAEADDEAGIFADEEEPDAQD